jgi:7-carboxy-7-deazaguanine synthase
MLIAETFYSLQGEGALTGVPSFFIRTSGCNLRCAWCDTPYASWSPEGRERSVEALVVEVMATPTRHVVLTGGEPLLARELPELTQALRARGVHITIETAATIAPLPGLVWDLASLSPKLANSTPPPAQGGAGWTQRHAATRYRPDVVAAWIRASGEATAAWQLKFVVSGEGDFAEIDALLAELRAGGGDVPVKIPAHQVQLMPEGTSVEALRARANWLGERCKERGHRYAHRLHVELYGHTRGT